MKKLAFTILFLLMTVSAHAQITISSLTPPPNGTYAVGSDIDITVNFSAPASVTGTPRLAMNIGGQLRYANYISGSGSTALVFRYSVVSGYGSTTGIGVASPVNLNGGSIAGATLTFRNVFYPGVLVNAPAPSIQSISLPATIPTLYLAGQSIDFTVTFSEPIIASNNTSRLKLVVGGTLQAATLLSGSGTSTFVYRYVVPIDNFDADGIEMVSPLEPNRSTLLNSNGMALTRTFIPPSLTAMKVDGRVPTILSNTKPADGFYTAGANFDFTLNYSRVVNVSGTPRVAIHVGYPPLEVSRFANYTGGSGTTTLTFRYTVQASDEDSDGVFFNQWLNVDLGGIVDDVGNSVSFAFWGLKMPNAGFSMAVLDGSPVPTISSVTPPQARQYRTGENLDLIIRYSKPVVVSLVPRISMNLGGRTVYANYNSGGGTDTLLFRYVVLPGDVDTDGPVSASSIDLAGGAIQTISMAYNAQTTFTSPDLSGVIVDGIDPVITSVTPPAPKIYVETENLNFIINYDEPVVVSGTPRLQLKIGTSTVYAGYVSGSTTKNLTFRFLTPSGLTDSDGVEVLSPLDLNGGTVSDFFGDGASLIFTSATYSGVKIDSILPTILSVLPPAPGTYLINSDVTFTVNLSEPIVITGTPRLALTVGATTKYALYAVGSGSSTLTFTYKVMSGDLDEDGIASSSPMDLSIGAIADTAGNVLTDSTFTPPDTSTVVVDGTSGISAFSSPVNGLYKTAAALDFEVTYPRKVIVAGVPRIKITVGAQTTYATYLSGSNSTTLVFRYVVAPGDVDSDGIQLTSPIELAGGSITGINGSSTIFIVPNTSGIRVDGITAVLSSITPPADGNYGLSQNLNFTLNFSDPAFVTGAPRIALQVGSSTLYAAYVSGSGTQNLLFRYTVLSSNFDGDGIQTLGPSVDLNGGAISDEFGDSATVTFSGTTYPNKKVDGVVPTILSLTGPANTTYGVGASLNFVLTSSEALLVTGTPRIALTIGTTSRFATYSSGSGSSTLNFSYTVVQGDFDSNGIAAAAVIDLNGGKLNDAALNNLSPLTFTPLNLTLVLVNGLTSISGISVPPNGSYVAGNALDFNVTFTAPVTVTGSPRIPITLSSPTTSAIYLSGSGSSVLTFRYTVASPDIDLDGISLATVVSLNGGDIRDSSGTTSLLSFTPPSTTGILITAGQGNIASLTPPLDGTYGVNANMDFTVNYSVAGFVTGVPRIQLTVGASTFFANYVSGSGTSAHIFRYTVLSSHNDANGIDTVGPAVLLNGGTIKDSFGNNFVLNFTAANYPNKKVDGIIPTILSLTGPANNTYSVGATLNFSLTSSKALLVTGTPRIALTIGTTSRFATYSSGSGSSTLNFSYTVAQGDFDSNGIAAASVIDLNGGKLNDDALNNLSPLTFTPLNLTLVLVNGLASISGISVPPNGSYATGSTLDFNVTFTAPVTVTGSPRIAITLSSPATSAIYLSGSGSSVLTFRYTVASTDIDLDGISLATAVSLNGGDIRDSSGTTSLLSFTPPSTTGILIVAGQGSIASLTPPLDGTYGVNANMDFTVNYSVAGFVTGVPRIQLTVGASTFFANYVSGSGTNAHIFRYTVLSTHNDANGIDTVGPAVFLNGGTIKDGLGNNFVLNFTAANYPNKKVDTLAPTVSAFSASANRTYAEGEFIDLTGTFSEPILVTGVPRIGLTIGATAAFAVYVSGSGTSALVFRYTVLPGALDTDGITSQSLIDLNGGTLKDLGANSLASLAFTPPLLTGVRVNAVSPTISSITPPATLTYTTGGNLNFSLIFNEAVAVTGIPSLTLNLSGILKNAVYVSGSGTTTLVFRYTVALGDNDASGVDSVTPLLLNGGTLKDLQGNNANLTFVGANYPGVKVDALAPLLSSVTLPASTTYKLAGLRPTMTFSVTYNEPVLVTGIPRLHLRVAALTRFATYASGSGTATLSFNYTVASELDLDGIDLLNSNTIDLNAGTIKDAVGFSAPLVLGTQVTSGILVVFSNIASWYDVSDSASLVFNGFNVSSIQDKVGAYTLTHTTTGATYNATNFNGGTNAYVNCSSTTSFNGAIATTPVAIVAVYRAPTTTANQFLFYSSALTRPMVQFTSTAAGGTVTFGVTGQKFSGNAWSAAGATATNTWVSGQVAVRGFAWTSTQRRVNSLCQMNGELAEAYFFDVLPTTAQMAELQSRINIRYGLNFP